MKRFAIGSALSIVVSFLALVAGGCDDSTTDGGGGAGGEGGESGTPPAGDCEDGEYPNDETEPRAVSADIVGTHTLEFDESASGGLFDDGELVEVEITADGRLIIGEVVLCAPFVQKYGGSANEAEIIWYDADTKLGYAASPNDGGELSEINVGDYDSPQDAEGLIPGFLGQLRAPLGAVDLSAVAEVSGVYAFDTVVTGVAPGSEFEILTDGTIVWGGFSYTEDLVESVAEATGLVTVAMMPRIVNFVEYTEEFEIQYADAEVSMVHYRPYAPTDIDAVQVFVSRSGDSAE